jgi:hypothetical protein
MRGSFWTALWSVWTSAGAAPSFKKIETETFCSKDDITRFTIAPVRKNVPTSRSEM